MGMKEEMVEILKDMDTEAFKLVRFDVELFKRTYMQMILDGKVDSSFIKTWSTIAGGLQRRVLLVDEEDNVVGHVNPLLSTRDNLNTPVVTNLLTEIDKKISGRGLDPKTAYDVFDTAINDNVEKEPFVVLYSKKEVAEEDVVNIPTEEDGEPDIGDLFDL